MCKENYSNKNDDEKIDAKMLKETCSAVKEAVSVVLSLDKNQEKAGEEVRIVFSDECGKMAE